MELGQNVQFDSLETSASRLCRGELLVLAKRNLKHCSSGGESLGQSSPGHSSFGDRGPELGNVDKNFTKTCREGPVNATSDDWPMVEDQVVSETDRNSCGAADGCIETGVCSEEDCELGQPCRPSYSELCSLDINGADRVVYTM